MGKVISLRIRKNSCLLFLFIAILMLGSCIGDGLFSKALKASRFSRININDMHGNVCTFTAENEITRYVEAINLAEAIQGSLSDEDLIEYQMVLEGKNAKHSLELTLYVDKTLENKNLYCKTEEGIKKIDEDYFNDLLVLPVFEPIYSNRIPPQVNLQYGSKEYLLAPGSYQWKYLKSDMNFYGTDQEQSNNNDDVGLTLDGTALPAILMAEEPDVAVWKFMYNDQLVLSRDEKQEDALSLEDGRYQCILELKWLQSNSRGFYGTARYSFDVQVDNPPEIRISALKTYPGELLVITADHVNEDEAVTITTDFDFDPNAFGKGSQKVILLPVSYYHKENKTYSVKVQAGDIVETFEVEVLKKDFITQYLTIDTKVAAATRNDNSAQEVKEKIDPLRPVCDDEKYWEGAFIQPVEGGRVTPADFGKRRHVNNAPTSYRHNGLDIGHDEGTPIKAANHGRVIFADYMIGTGYTVIIEHGYGLKSWYYHMVSLNTETGEMVNKGDVIGLVGSTGFSTGPHLHLSISINNVYVNPMPFFEEGVPLQ